MPTSSVRLSRPTLNNRTFRDILCHASPLILVAVSAREESSASGRRPSSRGRRGLFPGRHLRANETVGDAGENNFTTVASLPSPVEGYPDCEVDRPDWVGDGVCDANNGGYNTTECGWDGGDCLGTQDAGASYTYPMHPAPEVAPDAVEGYPNCHVTHPSFIGDGYCDDGEPYNTAECGWDGGDCLDEPSSSATHLTPPAPAAIDSYPDCHVDYPPWIGDGSCDCHGGYNTSECGWDGGDCLADTEPCGSYSYYDDYTGSIDDDIDGNNVGLVFIFFIGPALYLLANLANAIKKRRLQQDTMDPDLPAFRREQSSRRSIRPAAPDASAPPLAEISERTSRHEAARMHLQTCAFGGDQSPPIERPTALECEETDQESGEGSAAADGDEAKAEPECSICLCRFEKGEEVAWSTSAECDHFFHADCILQWLSSKRRNGSMHDSCPLCRHQIIPSGPGAA